MTRSKRLSLWFAIAACGWAAATTVAEDAAPAFHAWQPKPAMGWNSWDCFGAGVSEAEAMANADYMERNLKSHGWNLITIDIQWYEPLAHTTEYRKGAVLEMDANGRLLPAGNRFPMTKETRSFKPIGDAFHAKGLKFGLHLMRGIPRQAVTQNVPILGTNVRAADIADTKSMCGWNTDMYGVDMTKPGAQEYYDSVFAQMAEWGLDFVKVDDLSAPYHLPEIEAIRKAIDKTGRPIVFSTSPGGTPVNQGEHIQNHANQWRISGDFWDSWGALYEQFDRLNNWTPFRGPGHFPDADMIPFGNVRAWQTRDAWTHFTRDEHYTLMTLWSIARSPLIMGGHMPKNDEFTLSLLTNDEVIAVNQNSTNNRQVSKAGNTVVWMADVPGSQDKYVAVFNTSPAPPPRPPRGRRQGAATRPATAPGGEAVVQPLPPTAPATAPATTNPASTQPAAMSVLLSDLGLKGSYAVRDLWTHTDLGVVKDSISATVNSHGAVLYRLHPQD